MKRLIILSVFSLLLSSSMISCTKCKKCHAEVGMGGISVNSPEKEFCGDELKKAEETPGMVCK